jgi:hypothetical protein
MSIYSISTSTHGVNICIHFYIIHNMRYMSLDYIPNYKLMKGYIRILCIHSCKEESTIVLIWRKIRYSYICTKSCYGSHFTFTLWNSILRLVDFPNLLLFSFLQIKEFHHPTLCSLNGPYHFVSSSSPFHPSLSQYPLRLEKSQECGPAGMEFYS